MECYSKAVLQNRQLSDIDDRYLNLPPANYTLSLRKSQLYALLTNGLVLLVDDNHPSHVTVVDILVVGVLRELVVDVELGATVGNRRKATVDAAWCVTWPPRNHNRRAATLAVTSQEHRVLILAVRVGGLLDVEVVLAAAAEVEDSALLSVNGVTLRAVDPVLVWMASLIRDANHEDLGVLGCAVALVILLILGRYRRALQGAAGVVGRRQSLAVLASGPGTALQAAHMSPLPADVDSRPAGRAHARAGQAAEAAAGTGRAAAGIGRAAT